VVRTGGGVIFPLPNYLELFPLLFLVYRRSFVSLFVVDAAAGPSSSLRPPALRPLSIAFFRLSCPPFRPEGLDGLRSLLFSIVNHLPCDPFLRLPRPHHLFPKTRVESFLRPRTGPRIGQPTSFSLAKSAPSFLPKDHPLVKESLLAIVLFSQSALISILHPDCAPAPSDQAPPLFAS